jgi:signal transduction histidine kinase
MADRIDTDHFTFPQELMAHMLGVQRPTVSLTLQTLRRSGVISYRGRTLTIADRSGLERAACECHAVLRREFERLFRPPVAGLDTSPVLTRPPPEHGEGAAFETLREIAGRLLLASIREQRARDEAETANRAKDQFLAMVSHELRTPLNAIVGWSAMLKQRPDGSPEHGLEVIQRNAEALLKLVEDLLDAAPTHVLTIQPIPVDLRQIVYSAIDAITIAAHAKDVSLRTTIRDEAMPLMADADRLRQVFVNVLSNALKFTDARGSIEVCATMTRDRARVSIRDTGRGIGPDVLPHVFDRFRQGSNSTAGEHGLGLGLSISQALIRLHAGTIEIASPGPGQGTTCTIELPLSPNLSAELSPLGEAGANR